MRDWSPYCFMATPSSRAPNRMSRVFPMTVSPYSFSFCQSCFLPQPLVNFLPTNISFNVRFPRSLACNGRYSIMLKWNRTIEPINPGTHISYGITREGTSVYENCPMYLINCEASRVKSLDSITGWFITAYSYPGRREGRGLRQRCYGHALSTHLDFPLLQNNH